MTQPYPPQQPYYGAAPQPQQQYAPAPPVAAPQGYPGAVVTYPQPPQPQYTPAQQAPGGQGIMPPVPQLAQGGGGMGFDISPKLRHLEGRTVVVIPISINENAVDPATKTTRPEATFDLLVCDGGEIFYGDNVDDRNPEKNRPNTHAIQTPCLFKGASDIGKYFCVAVREALEAREPGRVGVVERGTKGYRPFMITRPDEHVDRSPREGGAERYQLGMKIFGDYWNAKHGGAPVAWPTPRSLVVAPPRAAPQVNYTAAPAAQPAAYGAYQAQPYGAPQPPQQGYAAPPMSAPPAYAAPQPPAADLPGPVAAWIASFPPEQQEAQRQAYLAQMAGQAQQQQPQAAAAGPGL
jgi:hypothetical protein